MKNTLLLSIGITGICLYSCSGSKNGTASAPPATPPPAVVAADDQPVSPGHDVTKKIRYVVSFISQGGGIDIKTKEEFTRFLDAYPKRIGYEPVQWGREGELDYCLSLNNMNAAEQAEFVQKANAILSRSKLVTAKENSPCEHSAWPPPAEENNKYRLVVSFFSKGEGTDLNKKAEFEKFVNSYPKKVALEPTTWGREGETDYCLKLSELTSSEQADFVRKAKEILIKSALVHVNENADCVHKH